MLWLFTGDSITQGAEHTGGARSYPQLFEEWIRYERGRPHDFVVNTAISGNFAEDLLAEYEERVARFRPDAVAVMLGTNDAVRGVAGQGAYRRALDEVVGRATRGGARAIVLTPPGVTPGASTRVPYVAAYAQAARDVAERNKATLVDIFADWTDRDGGTPRAWMDDAFHPNARGHREIARLLAARIDDAIVKGLF
jgi:lysophospholipase L1-like esterase